MIGIKAIVVAKLVIAIALVRFDIADIRISFVIAEFCDCC